jgi:hypothetical protein
VTLIEHWDGTAWRVAASPRIASSSSRLLAVAAVSPDDIWAVGESDHPISHYRGSGVWPTRVNALTEHWDGTSWTVVPSPSAMSSVGDEADLTARAGFDGVAVSPSDDVVAQAGLRGQVWRLSGGEWNLVVNGSSPRPRLLFPGGVTVIADDDAWIVGERSVGISLAAAAVHWNGETWTGARLPGWGIPEAISASGPQDIWGVGKLSTQAVGDLGPTTENYLLHYSC